MTNQPEFIFQNVHWNQLINQ